MHALCWQRHEAALLAEIRQQRSTIKYLKEAYEKLTRPDASLPSASFCYRQASVDAPPNAAAGDGGARSGDQAGGPHRQVEKHLVTYEQGVQVDLLADESAALQQRNADLEQVGAAAACTRRVLADMQRLSTPHLCRVSVASVSRLCSVYSKACGRDRRLRIHIRIHIRLRQHGISCLFSL